MLLDKSDDTVIVDVNRKESDVLFMTKLITRFASVSGNTATAKKVEQLTRMSLIQQRMLVIYGVED